MCGLAGLGLAVPFRLPTTRAEEKKDETKAMAAYRAALDATPEKDKEATRRMIFPQYLAKMRL